MLLIVIDKGSNLMLKDTIAYDCRKEIKDKNVQFKIYVNDINVLDMVDEVGISESTKVVQVKTIGDNND